MAAGSAASCNKLQLELLTTAPLTMALLTMALLTMALLTMALLTMTLLARRGGRSWSGVPRREAGSLYHSKYSRSKYSHRREAGS